MAKSVRDIRVVKDDWGLISILLDRDQAELLADALTEAQAHAEAGESTFFVWADIESDLRVALDV